MRYGKRRKEDREFDEAVERALDGVEVPAGSITGRHIKTNSIRPRNCDLSSSWDFTGSVTLPAETVITSNLSPLRLETLRVFDNHVIGVAPVVIADASKKNICLTLPLANANTNYVYILKRSDSSTQYTCTLMSVQGDKIDDVTSISIPARGSLICVSSGFGWHILANYS